MQRVPVGQSSCLPQFTVQYPLGKSPPTRHLEPPAHSVLSRHAPPTVVPSIPTLLPQAAREKAKNKPITRKKVTGRKLAPIGQDVTPQTTAICVIAAS